MKRQAARKITRFFVINPITDRREEARFDSREDVIIEDKASGVSFPGIAHDIGKSGLKLDTKQALEGRQIIQITFPSTPDHTQCFGRVIWSRPRSESKSNESGIKIMEWHGIVNGKGSWRSRCGFKPKKDRRNKKR